MFNSHDRTCRGLQITNRCHERRSPLPTLSLRDDHQTALAPILLGQHGQSQRDLPDLAGAEVVDLGVGCSLSLVAEYDVSEWKDRSHLVWITESYGKIQSEMINYL